LRRRAQVHRIRRSLMVNLLPRCLLEHCAPCFSSVLPSLLMIDTCVPLILFLRIPGQDRHLYASSKSSVRLYHSKSPYTCLEDSECLRVATECIRTQGGCVGRHGTWLEAFPNRQLSLHQRQENPSGLC
jgi:hypothetical protein